MGQNPLNVGTPTMHVTTVIRVDNGKTGFEKGVSLLERRE